MCQNYKKINFIHSSFRNYGLQNKFTLVLHKPLPLKTRNKTNLKKSSKASIIDIHVFVPKLLTLYCTKSLQRCGKKWEVRTKEQTVKASIHNRMSSIRRLVFFGPADKTNWPSKSNLRFGFYVRWDERQKIA